MKRLRLFVALAVLILGSALPALAQENQPTVTWTGQIRFVGVAWDNTGDFTDTKNGAAFKDSQSRFFERLRYWLTVQSADKKAKAVWNFQVGDLTLGAGDGVSAGNYPNKPSPLGNRTGTSAGGAAGARGINMQNRQLYIEFEPWMEGATVDLGIHYQQFLDGPFNEFYADNNGGVSFSWKAAPVDLNVWWAKIGKGANDGNFVSDNDTDFFTARVGVGVTPDIRVTLEGLVVRSNCFAQRNDKVSLVASPGAVAGAPATTTTVTSAGSCVDSSFGDGFWVGGTVNAKLGDIKIYGVGVWGKRPIYSAALNKTFEESGFGFAANATMPVGPLTVIAHAWYTTGDNHRIVGGNNLTGSCTTKARPVLNAGLASTDSRVSACSGNATPTTLNSDSDKLPVPIGGSSWGNMPYIGEALFGHNTLGGPTGLGQPLGADISGTWGIGGSVSYAITPAVNINGGVAFVGSTETSNADGGKNAIFGDHVFEIDAGPKITINPNTSFQAVLSYLVPETGDNAWAVAFRTIFAF